MKGVLRTIAHAWHTSGTENVLAALRMLRKRVKYFSVVSRHMCLLSLVSLSHPYPPLTFKLRKRSWTRTLAF